MENCEECRFLHTGYYGEGVCEFFGEDIPSWADNYTDGCWLKCQEVKKAIDLREDILIVGSSNELDEYGYPKWTKEDEEHNKKAIKKYDSYIEELKKRCEVRANELRKAVK